MENRCIKPKLVKYKDVFDANGEKRKLLEWGKPIHLEDKDFYSFACGDCTYCLKKYSEMWALRLADESDLHKESCFVTLTYNDENLPENKNLNKRDVQLFIKRLRKQIKTKIRYFLCGEYGLQKLRPHYHLIIFGWKPQDLVFFKKENKEDLFLSAKVADIWKNGFITVGTNMNQFALKYLSKYMSKLANYDIHNEPPFVNMSNRPGIGAGKIVDYHYDGRKIEVTNLKEDFYQTDGIYRNGKKNRIPRYYDKLAELSGVNLAKIKEEREAKYRARTYIDITQKQRNEYYQEAQKHGYGLEHLFRPGKKTIQKYINKYYDENDPLKKQKYYAHYQRYIKNKTKEFLSEKYNNSFEEQIKISPFDYWLNDIFKNKEDLLKKWKVRHDKKNRYYSLMSSLFAYKNYWEEKIGKVCNWK